MKTTLREMVLIILCVISITKINAAVCTAMVNGNWSNPATWSCGSVPGCGDQIFIPSGITVTVDIQVDLDENSSPACSSAVNIQIAGTLQFITGKKINLACGSIVEVLPGGSMLSGGGGGGSNWLEICEQTEWKSSDGPVYGYKLFGSPIPLAITLVEFQGKEISKNEFEIIWVVGTEINTKEFVVQISLDGVVWNLIGSVQSQGVHTENRKYMLHHKVNSFDHEVVFFRLIEVDLNGEHTILDEMSVHVSQSELEVFPNPTTGDDLITIQSQFPIEIHQLRIIDPQGRVFDITRFINQVNENTIQIDPLSLVPGIYQIHLASQVVRIVIK